MIKNVLIICKANYCRSPVAEKILQNYISDSIKVDSRGIINFFENSMDPRSREFLENKSLKNIFHIPKKINFRTLKNYDLVLSMDQEVYKYMDKFIEKNKHFIYSYNDRKEIIIDPINLKNKTDYFGVMDRIAHHARLWKEIIIRN